MDPGHFSPDVRDLIRLFAEQEVRYLLIGGEAVIYYGHPRLTGDVDFFYLPSTENAERLFRALLEFWDGSIPGLQDSSELAEPDLVTQFGRPPNRVDLISTISGVSFEEAYPGRTMESIEIEGRTIALPLIGVEALITNKRASGRPKDLDDVAFLEILAQKGPPST